MVDYPTQNIEDVIDNILESSKTVIPELRKGVVDTIGTRNLLLGTNRGAENWTAIFYNNHPKMESATVLGVEGCKFTIGAPSTTYGTLAYARLNINSMNNKGTYTLSFDVYVNKNITINYIGIEYTDGTHILGQFASQSFTANQWGKYKQTVTLNGYYELTRKHLIYIAGINVQGLEITFANMMLAEGSNTGSWLPAPEDTHYATQPKVYGFHIDGAEPNPSAKVTYIADAVGMTPAKMNYTTGRFDYGSWEDAFFMPRPCMLKYDGTVDYYLSTYNNAYKLDGETPSDISNMAYEGNAMMEWGRDGNKIWYKIVPEGDGTSASVYISNTQLDEGYKAWSFINNQGKYVDHFYTPIYNGSLDSSGRLRSMSGQACMHLKTAQFEVDAAKKNNPGSDILWYTEVFADIQLINLLLILIGKSTDTQTVFGNGHYTGSSSASDLLTTGTMDEYGLFDGTNGTGSGVKVFGMENWWGNQWRRYAGHILDNGIENFKLTYMPMHDYEGTGYNLDGTGYIESYNMYTSNYNGTYIKSMKFSNAIDAPDQMFMSTDVNQSGSSSSTYYCDGLWSNMSEIRYAYRGGGCYDGLLVGAFCVALNNAPSIAYWSVAASLSCKPLA